MDQATFLPIIQGLADQGVATQVDREVFLITHREDLEGTIQVDREVAARVDREVSLITHREDQEETTQVDREVFPIIHQDPQGLTEPSHRRSDRSNPNQM